MGKVRIGNTEIIDGELELPVGGSTGQVLQKKTNADRDVEWKDPASGLPTGGTTGQVLKKKTDTAFDVEWNDDETGGVSSTGIWGGM